MAARIIVVDRVIPSTSLHFFAIKKRCVIKFFEMGTKRETALKSMALKRRTIVMMINMVLVPCDMIIPLKSQKFPCISSNHSKNNWHNDVQIPVFFLVYSDLVTV